MATINCPRGCRWISQRPGLVLEFRDVSIFNNVCDHSDRCGISSCEYFDDTDEGDRVFTAGALHAQTLHGSFEDEALTAALLNKHSRSPK